MQGRAYYKGLREWLSLILLSCDNVCIHRKPFW